MVYKRLLFVLLSILCLQSFAQMTSDYIYIGVKGGIGMSWASYSELENRSPKMNSLNLNLVIVACFLFVRR